MTAGILEIVGFFVIVTGAGVVVAAASMHSSILGVLAAGVFLLLAGVIAVYVASSLERAKPKAGPNP